MLCPIRDDLFGATVVAPVLVEQVGEFVAFWRSGCRG